MKRTVLVVDDEQNMQTVMRMGEAGPSRTYFSRRRTPGQGWPGWGYSKPCCDARDGRQG